jgi:allophanate hydrolase subunit 2
MPGPHADRFDETAMATLFETTWIVSRLGDRVGIRLEGGQIARRAASDRAGPAPMVRGAMQVTTEGTPIVLGPDHPVTGGYPVLAVLGRGAQAMLARLRPGRAVRFVAL